jgi:hypothetical protein
MDSGHVASPEDAEDFLFHLYRGSELLLDNRVHEAKEELEQALKLQPRDAKGQDLLAVVYFRLGLYPRAIEIYEDLFRIFPDDASLAQNLSLCYLKTSQAERARDLLEKVVAAQPAHTRAWSYLGLAHEKLGDYEKAKAAFAHGDQPGMARRMDDLLATSAPPHSLSSMPPSARPPSDGFQDLGPDGPTLPGIAPKIQFAEVLPRHKVAAITSAMTMPSGLASSIPSSACSAPLGQPLPPEPGPGRPAPGRAGSLAVSVTVTNSPSGTAGVVAFFA